MNVNVPKAIRSPFYTQVPNELLDNMAVFSLTEFKILMFICRQTFGWRKKGQSRENASLSISFLAKGTGLSNASVKRACKGLLDGGLLLKIGEEKRGNIYGFNVAEDETPQYVVGSERARVAQKEPSTRLTESQGGGSERATNEENVEITYTSKDGSAPSETPPIPQPNRVNEFRTAWNEAFKAAQGFDYVPDYGKDGRAISAMLKRGLTVEQLIDLAKRAWAVKDKPGTFWCAKLVSPSMLAAKLNELNAEVNNAEHKRSATANPRNAFIKIDTKTQSDYIVRRCEQIKREQREASEAARLQRELESVGETVVPDAGPLPGIDDGSGDC